MEKIKISISILTLFAFLSLPISGFYSVKAESPTRSYVVTFKDSTPDNTIEQTLQQKQLNNSKFFKDINVAVIKTSDEELIQAIKNNPNVESIEQEGTINIPKVPSSDQLKADSNQANSLNPTDPIYVDSQWHIRRVKADQAWDDGYLGSHDTIVGIVDTGVANNHPDLASNIVYEECFTSFQTTCTPYPTIPRNMQGNHGTLVAGIVGSVIDGQGVIGVAPGVGLANYNVAEIDPNGIPTVYDSSIWAAMEDAGEQGIDVLNFSFSYPIQLPLSQSDRQRVRNWRQAIRAAHEEGVTMIAAAGNEGLDLDDPNTLVIPCELPHIICTGATNIRPEPEYPQIDFYDERTFYSSYGEEIDIAGPGGDCGGPDLNTCLTMPDPRYFVWTTDVLSDPTCGATESCTPSYFASIGTSLSTPHVVGVAALAMDAYKNETNGNKLTPRQVRRVLTLSAEDINIPELGAGMVDAEAAVQKAIQMAN